MKIGQLDPKAVAPSGSPERKSGATENASAAPAAPASGAAEPSAKVEISSAASALAASGSDGDFDADKVKRIQQAIANGSFKVNPEAIADKLIANAQELLGRTK